MSKTVRLVAFDLDGTLTQHRTPLSDGVRAMLGQLRERYKVIIVGAGDCERIYRQIGNYPIDVIGNYGMQYYRFDGKLGRPVPSFNLEIPCDKESVAARVDILRKKFGYTDFVGDGVEFHKSGCITLPILGTRADIADKLAFDPDRKRRRAIYAEVKDMFGDFNVYIGGSSSFDMSPPQYNKYYALDRYCADSGISHAETFYAGDDYGEGGNDESLCGTDFGFIKVDDYRDIEKLTAFLLV